MSVRCDGCSRLLNPAEEDGALLISMPGHRYRLCRHEGCAAAVLADVESVILRLRVQHGTKRLAWRARNLDLQQIRA